jgi:ubiquinone biosynthesis protein
MIAHTLLRMGTPMERVNIAAFKAEITRIMDTYLVVGELEGLNSQELANAILAAAQRFKIKMAPEYTILIKALTTIEGVIRTLYPDIDLVSIATPYIQKFMAKRFSPKNLMADSISGFAGLSAMMRQLPGQFEQIMHDAETGNIQVRAITPDLDTIAPMLHQLAGRLALTGFASTMTLSAVMLVTLATPGRVSWWLELAVISAATLSWAILWLWHLVGRGKPIRLRSVLQFFRR